MEWDSEAVSGVFAHKLIREHLKELLIKSLYLFMISYFLICHIFKRKNNCAFETY